MAAFHVLLFSSFLPDSQREVTFNTITFSVKCQNKPVQLWRWDLLLASPFFLIAFCNRRRYISLSSLELGLATQESTGHCSTCLGKVAQPQSASFTKWNRFPIVGSFSIGETSFFRMSLHFFSSLVFAIWFINVWNSSWSRRGHFIMASIKSFDFFIFFQPKASKARSWKLVRKMAEKQCAFSTVKNKIT